MGMDEFGDSAMHEFGDSAMREFGVFFMGAHF
jgi:hypothetical protein